MAQLPSTDAFSFFRFRPEAPEPDVQNGIRGVGIFREEIGSVVAAISLARLKPVELKSEKQVLAPYDDHQRSKIFWAMRDAGPEIVTDDTTVTFVSGTILATGERGAKQMFVGARHKKSDELVFRVDTGLWGDDAEVRRLAVLMSSGDVSKPSHMRPHGCYALVSGESEELAFAEHGDPKVMHAILAGHRMFGRPEATPLEHGQGTLSIYPRRTYAWRTFDGAKLCAKGCIPDTVFHLINDKGKRRLEKPTDQKKWGAAFEQTMWERQQEYVARKAKELAEAKSSTGAASS